MKEGPPRRSLVSSDAIRGYVSAYNSETPADPTFIRNYHQLVE